HALRGHGLRGALRAVNGRHQLAKAAWLKAVPDGVPLSSGLGLASGGVDGRIHHFLLPAAGWGSAVEAKEAKELAPEALQCLKNWRKSVLVTPTKKQTDELVNLGHRVEALWDLAHRRLQIAESEIRRSIDVWGADDLPVGGAVSRAQIEKALADARGAYRRLRLVMDAWCALWFWPLTDELTTSLSADGELERVDPPDLTQWIAGLRAVLGTHQEAAMTGKGRRMQGGTEFLGAGQTWEELGEEEALDLGFAHAASPEKALAEHPWLDVCQRIAAEQGFFHWELDFAPVFAARGGFDLQVGNPPWVRPMVDLEALLAEGDPWWQLKGRATQSELSDRRESTFALDGLAHCDLDAVGDMEVKKNCGRSIQDDPHHRGLQSELNRCFIEQTWRHVTDRGSIGLTQHETPFTDEKVGRMGAASYRRLLSHWQCIN